MDSEADSSQNIAKQLVASFLAKKKAESAFPNFNKKLN